MQNKKTLNVHIQEGENKGKVLVEQALGEYEFYCENCKTIHKKSAYAIAQSAMGVALVFTCDCGNKIDLDPV